MLLAISPLMQINLRLFGWLQIGPDMGANAPLEMLT
jgi:hypothetical protein